MKQDISIIGAGIGGLTTALTLREKGIVATVFEASSEIKPVGAGIIMANNAMQVFKKLGIDKKIEQAGNRLSSIRITDEKLKPISITQLEKYETQFGVHNVAIHRGALQRILADEVGYENIKLSKRLAKIEKEDVFTLTFDDQSVITSKIVLGADGTKSTVRKQFFSTNTLRNAHQFCWRGISEIELPEKYWTEPVEAWGKGKRFGFVKIGNKKVYWYALINFKTLQETEMVDIKDAFCDFHDDICFIIENTPKEQIVAAEIQDLKPLSKWYKEGCCLLGDAAHATTPNLGQGACQAVEDAYILAEIFNSDVSIDKVFELFEKIRKDKVNKIVDLSWKLGKIAQLENRGAIWLRNFAFRNFLNSMDNKQIEEIYKLQL